MLNFIRKNQMKILWAGIFAYILLFSALCLWKYYNFHYDNLDLAIFNQVFFNSSSGRLFQFSIHPGLYLGDHFTPIILLLLPFYYFFQSPIALLILQTIILGITALPVYLISRKVLDKAAPCLYKLSPCSGSPAGRQTSLWPLLISFLYLLNPFVHNTNLFEFHLLPFGMFFFLFAFYYYLRERRLAVSAFLLLTLLVREDMALIVMMFGLLVILNFFRKSYVWRKRGSSNFQFSISLPHRQAGNFFPFGRSPAGRQTISNAQIFNSKQLLCGASFVVFSIVYFFLAIKIAGYLNPQGSYKFLVYYSWLGGSIPAIIQNIFLRPIAILKHIFTHRNLEMILGAFLPFCFLPFFRPKYLLLSLPAFFIIILGASGGGMLVLQMHYIMLFLPAFFISFIYSLSAIINGQIRGRIGMLLRQEKGFSAIILIVAALYSSVFLGPLPSVAKEIVRNNYRSQIKKEVIAIIPDGASVIATYEFLPRLSSRENLYSLHYAFIGRNQYGFGEYVIPAKPDYILIDFDELFIYKLQFEKHPIYSKYYNNGYVNLKKLLQGYEAVKTDDNITLFKKIINTDNLIVKKIANQNFALNTAELVAVKNVSLECGKALNRKLVLSLAFADSLDSNNNFLRFSLNDVDKYVRYYAIDAFGSHQSGVYELVLPVSCKGKAGTLKVELVDASGHLELNEIRSLRKAIDKENIKFTKDIKLQFNFINRN